jgi:hypothetical protein
LHRTIKQQLQQSVSGQDGVFIFRVYSLVLLFVFSVGVVWCFTVVVVVVVDVVDVVVVVLLWCLLCFAMLCYVVRLFLCLFFWYGWLMNLLRRRRHRFFFFFVFLYVCLPPPFHHPSTTLPHLSHGRHTTSTHTFTLFHRAFLFPLLSRLALDCCTNKSCSVSSNNGWDIISRLGASPSSAKCAILADEVAGFRASTMKVWEWWQKGEG